jgi:hypothetical protein
VLPHIKAGRLRGPAVAFEKRDPAVPDADAERAKIMKEIGQPVMFQGADEYKVWLKQASDQYAALLKTLEIETK